MPLIIRKTITETFLDRVKTTPEAIAFKFKNKAGEWKAISFKEFSNECKLVAAGLRSLSVGPGDRVAIISNTRYEWVLSDISILGAGAITVPIYASSTADDVVYILNHSEAKVVFVENQAQLTKLSDKQEALKHIKKIILMDQTSTTTAASSSALDMRGLKAAGAREEAKMPGCFEVLMRQAKCSDLITVCYTSGTTGVPKGAMISHANMMSVIEDCCKAFKNNLRSEKERVIFFLPLSHIIGKVESMATYAYGWTGCFAESIDKLMINIAEVRPTLMFSVPRIFEKAYAAIQAKLDQSPAAKRKLFDWAMDVGKRYYSAKWKRKKPSLITKTQYMAARSLVFGKILQRFGGRLQFAVCGGAPLPPEIAEFFQIIGLTILEGYGLTETCGPVTLSTPSHNRIGTVGRPLGEATIQIAEDGEILIKSRKVFQGYFKQPEETVEVLSGSHFNSGDIGHIDEAGFLVITDRKKDLIVTSGGKNIAPQKIENLMKAQKYISQFVLHGDRRNYLTALVTLDHELVTQYANDNKILFSDFAGLTRHTKIQSLIQKQIDEVNSKLASFEQVKKFIILPIDFTIESGDLTPSLKVRRKAVSKKYESELEKMYD